MGQDLTDDNFNENGVSEDVPLRNINNEVVKSNKCNQCDFASSRADKLRRHLIMHSGEKPNKCNQCEYESSYASALRTHLNRHSGERPYKCNQCDYASSYVFSLRTHLKTHSEEKSNKCDFITGIPFEDTFENTQWRKVKQMQPM